MLMAVAFLFVLLVEWGSHSLAFAHSESSRGLVAIDIEVEHDDPCRSMTCCERRRSEQPASSFFHDLKPSHSVIEIAFENNAVDRLREAVTIPREDAHPIFRPAEPPIHPPELS
jgi:hypothetical protein